MNEAPGGITAALIAFQADLPEIGKTSTAQYGAYADLADVSKVLLPVLARHGICYTAPLVRTADHTFLLNPQLRHISGETIDCEWPITVAAPQTMGSAITYGRRYCLLAMTGVHPAGEDDDAQLASKEHQKLAKDTVKAPRKASRAASTRDDTDQWSTAPQPGPGGGEPGITDPQLRMIGALMREQGIIEKEAALELVASVIGRRIESRKELTRGEAGQVIDALRIQASPPAGPRPPAGGDAAPPEPLPPAGPADPNQLTIDDDGPTARAVDTLHTHGLT